MRVFVHVHDAGRVRKREAFPPAKVQELVERLMAALAIVKARTRDDVAGHEFHGNQWTGGLGAKPKQAAAKGVKMGVHELLSSGHPFTMEELQQATGATTLKQVSDALAMLKNPKYAGPKGTLGIVKAGSEYHVQPVGGEPAQEPAAPPAPAGMPPQPTKAEVASLLLNPDDDPEPEWEEGMEKVMDPAQGALSTSHPPAAPLSKAEADAKYEAHMATVLAVTQDYAKGAAAKDAGLVALAFKQAKAKGMADWAANVKGIAVDPKKQEVHKADLKLVNDLAQGMKANEALAAWKKNTALEKQGLFPPKAAVNAPPKPHLPPAAAPVQAHAPAFEQVADYVPDSHAGVAKADFLPAPGTVNGEFAARFNSARSKFLVESADNVQNKMAVQKALEARLAGSAAFQSIDAQRKKAGLKSTAAYLISAWAGSSGDTHPVSVANQISVREAFGMSPDDVSTGNMHNLHTTAADDEKVFAAAASEMKVAYATAAEKETFRAGMRDFALAQYANTQDRLKEMGITELHVVRGMKIAHGAHASAKSVDLKLQPASSFTLNYSTSETFAGGQTLYLSKVPASQVLGTYLTGYGCTGEHEVVVLAHPKTQAIQVPQGAAGGSISSASAYIRDTLPDDASSVAFASSPAAKKAAMKYTPPAIPKGAHNGYTKNAKELAAKGDLEGLTKIHEHLEAVGYKKSAPYVKGLMQGVQAHKEKLAAIVAMAPAAPAKKAAAPLPAGLPPTKAKAAHVPHAGPAPYAHSVHSHFDPVEYGGWVAKGMSTHQLGKKLAMKKFMAKKAEAA